MSVYPTGLSCFGPSHQMCGGRHYPPPALSPVDRRRRHQHKQSCISTDEKPGSKKARARLYVRTRRSLRPHMNPSDNKSGQSNGTARRPIKWTINFFPTWVGIKVDKNRVVTKVTPGSQADEAGVKCGFKVLRVIYPVKTQKDVYSQMERCRRNSQVNYSLTFRVPPELVDEVRAKRKQKAREVDLAAAKNPNALIFLCSPWGTYKGLPRACDMHKYCGPPEPVTVDDVRALLELNPNLDVNAQYGGTTAVDMAILSERIDVIRYLIELGADINSAEDSREEQSPLIRAMGSCNVQLMRDLIKLGVRVTENDVKVIQHHLLQDKNSTLYSVMAHNMPLRGCGRAHCVALLKELEAAYMKGKMEKTNKNI